VWNELEAVGQVANRFDRAARQKTRQLILRANAFVVIPVSDCEPIRSSIVKAIICTEFGQPDLLETVEVPDPVARPGELLVAVKACSVNFPDLLMIQGMYQVKPHLPFIPGSEVGGVVTSVGDGVQGYAQGDRVVGSLVSGGGLAERVSLQADRTFVVPDAADLADATGFFYSYGTSYYALRDRANLQPGESLVVLGAAGAVGLTAVELGNLMGARVIAAASSETKLELCRAHGATETINYSTEDLKTRIRELTGGTGADVIFDPVGGSYSEPALRSMAWNGRFLVVGFAAGDIARIPLNLALLKGCSVVGVFWGRFVGHEPEKNERNRKELIAWWRSGQLNPHASNVYPFDQAVQAFLDMAERRAVGRIVVSVS
jgi:NADPH:quinone reductase